ncbi:carbamoyl phosphate synthase small subunit [Lentilactobacillus sp. SPB1-3]|uniref:Carbamoyl phosphate synthase small subunit n=1 Tax=Lentilactobacillus terminaliae TaxID=3003483 RepID=A0ACD5DCG3_9LACO|nr:carbamoyl phosphate synthase small subunit [Lentilactobacillus sp. SPB1-3]MCZ0977208.1 carbamoyl phosphate synthase small subunit [Lentilactobacillus sp. SPB1-3]
MADRYLILEDGTSYRGKAFGAASTTTGEIVVNSTMNGYQEIISNQIYHNQIIVFTQPSIGNTGLAQNAYESVLPTAKGVIVREYENLTTDQFKRISLDRYLKLHKIPGLYDIDTRELVHHLHRFGNMKASIVDVDDEHAFDQLHATVLTNQQVSQVATARPYANPGDGDNVIVVDFGLKSGILRELSKRNCNITVVPADFSSERILDLDPDGVVLSTGPGNPASLPDSVLDMIREVQQTVPMFAIGLGHELFAMANGANVEKLPIEHHGSNHPIREIITNEIFYSGQEQGYVVDSQSIDHDNLYITHIDLINGTVQGLRHRDYPAFSVQFSPDGAPGPKDSVDLFDDFIEIMARRRENNASRY